MVGTNEPWQLLNEISGAVNYTVNIANASGITIDCQVVLATPGLRCLGWSGIAVAATPSVFNVCHGTTTTDPIIGYDNLPGRTSATPINPPRWFGPRGIACPNGIFVDHQQSGAAISVYWSAGSP